MKTNLSWIRLLLCVLMFGLGQSVFSEGRVYFYHSGSDHYRYWVERTGENFTFKFDTPPPDTASKLKAAHQLLQQVYLDDSIERHYSQHYIRERARCYVFDSRYHTYTLCFLPNDFNRSESERFWGFVTQVPNWKWLASRIFAPVSLIFVLFFYLTRKRPV